MFRQMLMGSAARVTRYPENDDGAEAQDDYVEDDAAEDEDEDDEQEDELPEDGDDAEDEEDEEPVRKPTRGENRVAAATRTAAEAKARADALERENAALKAGRTQDTQAETQRQRAERLAAMSAEERLEYLIKEQGQQTEAQLAQIRFASWDANDKAEFTAAAAGDPVLKGLAAEVEKVLADLRATGGNNSRDNIATFLLGQRARNKATKSTNAGAKRSAAAKERQGARPTSGRGDVPADRTRGDKNDLASLEKRLAGVKI